MVITHFCYYDSGIGHCLGRLNRRTGPGLKISATEVWLLTSSFAISPNPQILALTIKKYSAWNFRIEPHTIFLRLLTTLH